MTILRTVSAAVIAALFVAAMPKSVWADDAAAAAPLELRTAIDRAAAQYAGQHGQRPADPRRIEAARSRQMTGGGGGKGMLVWTIVGTVTSLAATYFVIKEVRKQTDQMAQD